MRRLRKLENRAGDLLDRPARDYRDNERRQYQSAEKRRHGNAVVLRFAALDRGKPEGRGTEQSGNRGDDRPQVCRQDRALGQPAPSGRGKSRAEQHKASRARQSGQDQRHVVRAAGHVAPAEDRLVREEGGKQAKRGKSGQLPEHHGGYHSRGAQGSPWARVVSGGPDHV